MAKEVYLYFRTNATLADDDDSAQSGVFLLSRLTGMHPTSDTALTLPCHAILQQRCCCLALKKNTMLKQCHS